MKNQKLGIVLVTVAVAGGAAHAERAKPAWCQEHMAQGYSDALTKPDVEDQLRAVQYLMCNPAQVDFNEPQSWPAIDAAYKQLSARFALTDADWTDVVEWANAYGGNRFHSPKSVDPKKPWSQLSPYEQWNGMEHNAIAAGKMYGGVDAAYFADALGTKLSELGRLGWVNKCMVRPDSSSAPVTWAICQPDIDLLDSKKILAEVKSDKNIPVEERMAFRLAVDGLKQKLADHAADVKQLLAKDPVYAQIFDVAKKARAEWDGRAPNDASAVLEAMEEALVTNSRKATDGCHDKTWSVVKSVVSKVPAKAYETKRKDNDYDIEYMSRVRDHIANAVVNNIDGYAAASAYVVCRNLTAKGQFPEEDGFAGSVETAISRWPGLRGPRTTGISRVMLAGLTPDDRDARIEYPEMKRPMYSDVNGSFHGNYGTVSKIVAKGDKVHFEFQQHKVTWEQPVGCRDTNKIRGIRSDGSIEYEYVCKGTVTKSAMEGPVPSDVSAETAKSVKNGMVIMIFFNDVLAAWKDNKSTVPVLVLGQPVK